MEFGEYKHLKTGNIYNVLVETTAINSTNAQDGQVMVLYENKDGKLFVREITEFNEKFEKV